MEEIIDKAMDYCQSKMIFVKREEFEGKTESQIKDIIMSFLVQRKALKPTLLGDKSGIGFYTTEHHNTIDAETYIKEMEYASRID